MAQDIDITDNKYPLLLSKIPDPPKILYFKDKIHKDIFKNCLAVVGSRKMSLYGRRVINYIFSTLSKKVTIVSGFMYGVDAYAHETALRLGLKTIVVMPCGIDYIHPEDQKDLYKKILDSQGLILSEYPSDFKPKLWTYPKRNRIVAGLCMATLVVEADLHSGSLITANLAHSYGREVFVVPGSIFSNLSRGKIQISNLFAKEVCSGSEINKYLCLESFGIADSEYKGTPIIKLLNSIPLSIDEISENLSKPVSEVSSEITDLSIKGLISEEGGKFYAC